MISNLFNTRWLCRATDLFDFFKEKPRKRILLVSHELTQTGAPRALLSLALMLRELGAEVEMVSLSDGELQQEIVDAGLICRIPNPPIHTMHPSDPLYVDTLQYISSFDLILFNTIATLHLVEQIKEVHVKKVCWLHDGSFAFRLFGNKEKLSHVYPLYDRIFAVGDYACRIAASMGPEETQTESLLYGTVDIAKGTVKKTANEKTVMVLAGSIEKRKGQHVLVESLHLLSADIRSQLKIYVVGRTLDERIYRQVSDAQSACLELCEAMPHEELMDLFSRMDILLCPSLDDPMPIVCTEAMMLSKPVIVSDHTGTASFIEDGVNGYVVSAGDPVSLAGAITRAVKLKATLPRMGMRSRRIYKKYFTTKSFKRNVKNKLLTLVKG